MQKVKILHGYVEPAIRLVPDGLGGALLRGANHGPIAGCCLPWSYIEGGIAVQLHRLRFDTSRIVADATFRIGYAGHLREPLRDGIAPNDGVSGLKLQTLQDLYIDSLGYLAVNRFPCGHLRGCGFGAPIMRVVDVLDHRF